VIHGECVIDGRGAEHLPVKYSVYQKFSVTELLLSSAHDFDHPILMDACVEQLDGFRFFYILPFGPKRLFIEDTYFSESPLLDAKLVDSRVMRYARRLGLQVDGIGRQERGVLLMPWKAKPKPLRNGPELCIGARGDWYHPATAYSVPFAIHTALAISAANGGDDLRRRLGILRQHHEKHAAFARFLNMLLFQGFEPEERVHVFERFYRLPVATIQRFYSLDMTVTDRLRLLFGRPPRGFSLGRVLGANRI
jgi:lycopene beta-cyclase